MKIERTGGVDLYKIYQRQASEQKPGEPPRTEGARAADRVELSAQARALQVYQRKLAEMPAIREELVERLRAEIRDGVYRDDARRIAEGLLAEWGVDRK